MGAMTFAERVTLVLAPVASTPYHAVVWVLDTMQDGKKPFYVIYIILWFLILNMLMPRDLLTLAYWVLKILLKKLHELNTLANFI